MRMYELTDAYVSLLNEYDEAQTDEDRADIIAQIEEVEQDIAKKGENYARLIKNATADSDALADEIKRLQAKKAASDNFVKRLKENLMFAMGIAGATEIKTTIGKWYIQKNPPKVTITDEMMVPARFLIEQPPVIDKKAILAEFKQTGEVLNGIEITREDSVRFR